MGGGGFNFLKWTPPPGGWAVRKLETGAPELWMDSDGGLVDGDDPHFCLALHGGDKWLFLPGDAENPCAISGVPEAPPSDVSTATRIVPADDGTKPPPNKPPSFKPPTPAPADGTFTCYRVGIRCQRLMLAQNAVLTPAGKCDFSDASVRWLAPMGEDAADTSPANTRPVSYPDGKPDRYAAASFPSAIASATCQRDRSYRHGETTT